MWVGVGACGCMWVREGACTLVCAIERTKVSERVCACVEAKNQGNYEFVYLCLCRMAYPQSASVSVRVRERE